MIFPVPLQVTTLLQYITLCLCPAEQCETDKKIALEESPQDLAHNALVREGIKDAGMNYNIILSMPDDIQSIIHRTALRRQLSR